MDVMAAEVKHTEQVSALYQDLFAHNANQQPTYYKAATENGNYPKYIISSPEEELFIALEGETVLGFAHVSEDKTPPFECYVPLKYAVLVDLYVAPKYRRRGIATALINAAKQWAKDRQLSYMELNVLENNENAILLYKREDFSVVSHVMRCTL